MMPQMVMIMCKVEYTVINTIGDFTLMVSMLVASQAYAITTHVTQ